MIFISYRRDENAGLAGRIYDRLQDHFGAEQVFMDVESIPYGAVFPQHLSEMLSNACVLLAVIAEQWVTIEKEGKRRLDDPKDFVRIEIATALAREIPVIPVLIGKAAMPTSDQLPADLVALADRQGAPIDTGRDFRPHLERLIRTIEKYVLPTPPTEKLIQPGDLVTVSVSMPDQWTIPVYVDELGFIQLPYLEQPVKVAGFGYPGATRVVSEAYVKGQIYIENRFHLIVQACKLTT